MPCKPVSVQNDSWTNLLAWSNANFANPTGWSSYTIPLASAGDRALDLAIDSQDRPHLVYASASMNIRYLQCTSNCETEDSVWQVQDVETGAEGAARGSPGNALQGKARRFHPCRADRPRLW